MYYGFQTLFPKMLKFFRDDGLEHIESNNIYPINIILLVIIDKFDPNSMLVNINKLKPYWFVEDRIVNLY
jgi:hypothetical protein